MIQFIIIILLIIITLGFVYWHEEYSVWLNTNTVTIGDYTLLLSGLPHGEKYNGIKLREILLKTFRMNGYYLKGINFVYNTNKYTQKKEMLWKSISSLYKMEYIKEHNTDQLTEISEKGNLLDDVNF